MANLHIEVTYEGWCKTSVKMYGGLQTHVEKIHQFGRRKKLIVSMRWYIRH